MVTPSLKFHYLLALGLTLFLIFNTLYSQHTASELFEKALYLEEAKGDLTEALDLYLKILEQFPENREVAARAQLHIGICYEKSGSTPLYDRSRLLSVG